jgi:hypothetical protein
VFRQDADGRDYLISSGFEPNVRAAMRAAIETASRLAKYPTGQFERVGLNFFVGNARRRSVRSLSIDGSAIGPAAPGRAVSLYLHQNDLIPRRSLDTVISCDR